MEASENQCMFTSSGAQDSTCPLYKKWEKTKKQAYNVKITLSIENHLHEVEKTYTESDQDIDQSIKKLVSELKKVLNKRQWQAFDLLFIQNLSDEDAAKEMGFKSSESGRKAGYKQIKNLKNTLKEKAEKILDDKGIVFLNGDTNETDKPTKE
jgi:DNA-directed RNA polymerase specialized sigma24 family protein